MHIPFQFLIVGFIVGLQVGLTGMGGAALMTPFLVMVVGMKPTFAVGTDLVYSALTKWIGAVVHWRQGTVNVALAKRIAYGSIPGGILGVITVTTLQHYFPMDTVNVYLRRSLGITLAVVAVVILVRTFAADSLEGLARLRLQRWCHDATIVWGAFVGFTVGLTSIGSGSLLMPFLTLLYPDLAPAAMVGTDVFHACLLVSVTGFMHAGAGNVDWGIVLPLLAGSAPGVIIGSRLAPRMPQRLLKIGLGVTLLLTGARMVP